jgi:large subunit ribosomal protein L18e
MRTGPSNYELQKLLLELENKALESRFWRRIKKDLTKSSRQRRSVNVYKIDKFAKAGETVIIPGKVLSLGQLTKKVDVAAFTFSTEARRKIQEAQGKTLSIQELLQQNPEGRGVKILG